MGIAAGSLAFVDFVCGMCLLHCVALFAEVGFGLPTRRTPVVTVQDIPPQMCVHFLTCRNAQLVLLGDNQCAGQQWRVTPWLYNMRDICQEVMPCFANLQDIHHKVVPEEVELVRRDYTANGGWETFLAYEDPSQVSSPMSPYLRTRIKIFMAVELGFRVLASKDPS